MKKLLATGAALAMEYATAEASWRQLRSYKRLRKIPK